MERIYVYKIVNNLNGKYYIGVHKHTGTRKDTYMGSGKLIRYAVKKYGVENFTKEILKEFDDYKEASDYEKYVVTLKEVNDKNCYNLAVGGAGIYQGNKKPVSKETKTKISNSLKGKKNPFYGKRHSNESKKIIGEKSKGRNIGRKKSKQERVNNSIGVKKAWETRDRNMSTKQKQKISNSMKSSNEQTPCKICKKIISKRMMNYHIKCKHS